MTTAIAPSFIDLDATHVIKRQQFHGSAFGHATSVQYDIYQRRELLQRKLHIIMENRKNAEFEKFLSEIYKSLVKKLDIKAANRNDFDALFFTWKCSIENQMRLKWIDDQIVAAVNEIIDAGQKILRKDLNVSELMKDRDERNFNKLFVETKQSLNKDLAAVCNDINKIVDILWEQRKYAGFSYLLMSPIIVQVVYDYNDKLEIKSDLTSNKFSEHYVFRVKKCTTIASDPLACCAIFVDEVARVYQNWNDFLKNNRLRNGLLLFPSKGVYLNGSQISSKIKSVSARDVVDIIACVGGVVAAGTLILAATPLIAAAGAVAATATVTGIATTTYTGLRSTEQLIDRKLHAQSIGLFEPGARMEWLNISLCAASGIAMTARKSFDLFKNSQKFAQLIENNPKFVLRTQMAVELLEMLPFGISGICIGDCITIMIIKLGIGEEISYADFSKLSAALFVFTHSVNNHVLALELLRKISSNDGNSIDLKKILFDTRKSGNNLPVEVLPIGSFFRGQISQGIIQYVITYFIRCRNINDFKLQLIEIFEKLTIDVFDVFMSFVEETVNKIGEYIQGIMGPGYMELLLKTIDGLLTSECKLVGDGSLRHYIRQLSNEQRCIIIKKIKQFFDVLQHGKINVNISFEAIDAMEEQLRGLEIVANYDTDLVKDAIKEIRINLSAEATNIYLTIFKKFAFEHAQMIQNHLQCSIPIHIFIREVYIELCRMYDGRGFENHLLEFTSANFILISQRLADFYINQFIGRDLMTCKDCMGKFYNNQQI